MHRPAGFVFLWMILATTSGFGENWPGWRGPRGDGSSIDKDVPTTWNVPENQNVAWKTPLPYTGHSSPVVWNDRIFVTGADEAGERRMLVAFDRREGKILWEREVEKSPLERKHKLNSWASGTPVTDGERIYVSFLDGKDIRVTAYTLDGDVAWEVKPGGFSSVHGFCSCPVLYQNLVIINGDHDGDSYLVALDRSNGQTVWKTPREHKTRSYCTPIIRNIDGRTQMILSGSKCVASYDPATGKQWWILDGPTEQFVASPVMNAGLIFITGGFPDKHIIAIDPSGNGKITAESHIKWRHLNRGVSYVPSPVAAGDFFFCVSDEGIATCYDARTGSVEWFKRLGPHHSSSLVAANGNIYFLDDAGTTHVIAADKEFQIVAQNPLGEEAYSSPAISDGQIFIRGTKHLIAIGSAD